MAASPTTVVVVHRDRPRLLAATLEALAAQTVPVRVLLVDSGSSEADHAEAAALLPPGSDVVRMGRNGGFGPSANAGWRRFLAEHEGEWVGLCPHDALPAPDAIERILAAVAERPRAGFACGDYGDGATPVVDPYFGSILVPATVAEGWEPSGYPHGTLLLARRARSRTSASSTSGTSPTARRPTSACGRPQPAGRWASCAVRVVFNPNMSNPRPVIDYLMVRNTLLLVRSHSGRYKASIRFGIAVAQLWTERRRSPYHHTEARLHALADFLRGRYGPPPARLVGAGKHPDEP